MAPLERHALKVWTSPLSLAWISSSLRISYSYTQNGIMSPSDIFGTFPGRMILALINSLPALPIAG
jgi:hypothetical protein